MIDLHLHTTASDGRLSPADLVSRAAAAGLTTISVTDHDTVAAIDEATRVAHGAGLRVVPGIEVTSVDSGRDIHLLAYFFDREHVPLLAFLTEQRHARVARVHDIVDRLAALGCPLALEEVMTHANDRPGRAIGRPQVARALVLAGHAVSTQDAFDRFLGAGAPAYVPRRGPTPQRVIAIIHHAQGVTSFAHPAVTARDDLIASLAADGLDALEVFHSDHDRDAEAKYLALARQLELGVTGGSDFHGDPPGPTGTSARSHRTLGSVRLPPEHFEALERAHRDRPSGARGADEGT